MAGLGGVWQGFLTQEKQMDLREAIQYKEVGKCMDRPGKCAEVIEWLIEQLENQNEQKTRAEGAQETEADS